MLYNVLVHAHLELSSLLLHILYEDCTEYVFNINVNILKCNGISILFDAHMHR